MPMRCASAKLLEPQAYEGFHAGRKRGPMLHIDIPTLAEFKALAQVKGETCVSLYLPTSPLGENAKLNRTGVQGYRQGSAVPVEGSRCGQEKNRGFRGAVRASRRSGT